jgi:hypothetical protein
VFFRVHPGLKAKRNREIRQIREMSSNDGSPFRVVRVVRGGYQLSTINYQLVGYFQQL